MLGLRGSRRRASRYVSLATLSILVVILTNGRAEATTGMLDSSYGGDGVADIDPALDTMTANALRVLDDGTVVLAAGRGSSSRIVRVRPDGTVDSTFAANVPTPAHYVSALTVDGFDRVVTVESSGSSVIVRRVLSIGVPDLTLDGDGVLTIPVPQIQSMVADVQIDHHGRIVLLYRQFIPESGEECVVTRRLPTGLVDPTFNGGAPLSLRMPYSPSMGAQCLDLAVRGDNSVYVADSLAGIVAVSPGGVVEPGHLAGAADFLGQVNNGIRDIQLLPGDALALGAATFGGQGWRFAVARLTASGDLDPTFGTNGVSVVGFGDLQPDWSTGHANSDRLAWIDATPDGGLVAGGGTSAGLALARWDGDQLDANFGTGGRVVIRDQHLGVDHRLSTPRAGAVGADGAAYTTSNRSGALPPLTLVRIPVVDPPAPPPVLTPVAPARLE